MREFKKAPPLSKWREQTSRDGRSDDSGRRAPGAPAPVGSSDTKRGTPLPRRPSRGVRTSKPPQRRRTGVDVIPGREKLRRIPPLAAPLMNSLASRGCHIATAPPSSPLRLIWAHQQRSDSPSRSAGRSVRAPVIPLWAARAYTGVPKAIEQFLINSEAAIYPNAFANRRIPPLRQREV